MGQGPAGGVGDVEGGGARLDHFTQDLVQEGGVRPACKLKVSREWVASEPVRQGDALVTSPRISFTKAREGQPAIGTAVPLQPSTVQKFRQTLTRVLGRELDVVAAQGALF